MRVDAPCPGGWAALNDAYRARPRRRRLAWPDPGLVNLRASTSTMLAVLASYGSALVLEHAAGLHVDVLVQSVVLAISLARTQQGADIEHRLTSFVVMPVLAVAAAEVGRLITSDPNLGDCAFLLAVSGTFWIRRFGPRISKVAAITLLPLISILVLQGSAATSSVQDHSLWAGLVALIAAFWVFTFELLAGVTGLGPRARLRPGPRASKRGEPARDRARIAVTTRMALQMALALALAFAVGRSIWPSHWTWTVLSAFIVCGGARRRGDAVRKGALRTLGAGAGTILATTVAATLAPRDQTSIVLIFAVLAVGTWLRPLSYAYWAGCVTAALSLLYGYFGESASSLLYTRLEAIVLGALIGIASSWLVFATRNGAALRSRLANTRSTQRTPRARNRKTATSSNFSGPALM